MRNYLIILFSLISIHAFAQISETDSLVSFIQLTKLDSSKVSALNDLSEQIWRQGDYELARKYADEALSLSDKNISTSNTKENNWFLKGKANAYNNIAIVYRYRGNYAEGLKNHFAALKIREEIADKKGIARSYIGIASIYNFMGNNTEALDYNFKSKKLYEELKDKNSIANVDNHIGRIYFEENKNDEALKYFGDALSIWIKDFNIQGQADTYSNVGRVYEKTGKYQDAIDNFKFGLTISTAYGLKNGIIEGNYFLGSLYLKTKNYKEASKYFINGLILAKQIGSKEHQKNIYNGLAQLDSANHNYTSAFEHYKMYVLYRDSLVNQKTSETITQMQVQFENEKKEQIRNLQETEKENKRTAAEKQQQLILYSVSSGLLLMFVLAIVIYRGSKQKQKANKELLAKNEIIEKQKHIVEEKQKEIIDSIKYAKRIQQSQLPTEKYIIKSLNKLNK